MLPTYLKYFTVPIYFWSGIYSTAGVCHEIFISFFSPLHIPNVILRNSVSCHVYASFMLMLRINMPLCEVALKPKSAEGWMLLFRLRENLNLAFRKFFISGNSGPFEEASSPVVEWRPVIRQALLHSLSRKINRNLGWGVGAGVCVALAVDWGLALCKLCNSRQLRKNMTP
jgi:hypothetical protein